LSLSRQSFEYGGTSYVQLLDAQRTAAQARLAVIQSQAARFTDSVALYQALAGSW
jgi:outer membrane protein TolC